MGEKENGIRFISLKELGHIEGKERRQRLIKGKWGAWYLTKDRECFGINRLYPYEIEFSEIKRRGPLQWFAHLREKTWLKRGDLDDLINAFDDLFGPSWIYDSIKGKSNE